MNSYIDIKRMIEIGEHLWNVAKTAGLIDLKVRYENPPYYSSGGREFVNMCSCSYLGLDTNPHILEGAMDGIQKAGSLHLTTARVRMYTELLQEVESKLSSNFNCDAISYNSCAAATSAYLPVLASGAITGGQKPTMIFDKFAHFSIGHIKPICGDETEVITSRHNDVDEIEKICKKSKRVAYVCDGTYSISGHAKVEDLKFLQDKYGLFLYFDDSHSLSIIGENGEGYIRGFFPELNDNTVVVGSLAKAFGVCGGVLMSSSKKNKDLLVRYGNSWSQYMNSAGLGGILASLDIHRSKKLKELQFKWQRNLRIFDEYFGSSNFGTLSPIRLITLQSPDSAIEIAQKLFKLGFYTSAVFFPIVPRGMAGLRVMPRADIDADLMRKFCEKVHAVCGDEVAMLKGN